MKITLERKLKEKKAGMMRAKVRLVLAVYLHGFKETWQLSLKWGVHMCVWMIVGVYMCVDGRGVCNNWETEFVDKWLEKFPKWLLLDHIEINYTTIYLGFME